MSDYLPACLLSEIFRRLPVESLLRFRCVSKQVCSLISSPAFISTHLSHSLSPTTTPLFLLRHFAHRPTKKEYYSVYLEPSKAETLTLAKELKFPFKTRDGYHFRVAGFCNGVFCLSDDLFGYTYTIILWNPAIRKSLTLPKPSVHFGPYGPYMFCLGFGSHPKTSDLKVVRVAYVQDARGIYQVPPVVEVFSLSTGTWKTVDSKGVRCKLIEYYYSSVCFNGAIHWASYCKDESGDFCNSLLVFDLRSEKFSSMGLPLALFHALPLDLTVSLCGDRICMFWYEKGRDDLESCDRCVVWVMNEYGKHESWTQKFVVVLESGFSHAIGFIRNGEFLLEKLVGDLMSYDPASKEFKDLGVHGVKDSFFMSNYVESLVLLDGSNGATATSNSEGPTGMLSQLECALNSWVMFKHWGSTILYAKSSLCGLWSA